MKLLFAVLLVAAVLAVAQPAQRVELVLPGPCVEAISPGKNFECRGPDKEHMTCKGIILKFSPACMQVHAVRDAN